MGKGHKDNHKARKKRGTAAFALKNERRKAKADTSRRRCRICGTVSRASVLVDKICPLCQKELGLVKKSPAEPRFARPEPI